MVSAIKKIVHDKKSDCGVVGGEFSSQKDSLKGGHLNRNEKK